MTAYGVFKRTGQKDRMILYCEHCQTQQNGRIFESKYLVDGSVMAYTKRRRRRCSICGKKWVTIEINKNELLEIINERKSKRDDKSL